MTVTRLPSVFATLLLVLAGTARAHHGLANFDLNTDLTLKGTIAEVALINPHSWIYVNVKEADGKVSKWKCEMRGGTVLRRSGWGDELFKVGTEVTITGSPDRFDRNTCYMGSIYFASGLKMDRYGQLVESERKLRKAFTLNRLPNGNPDIGGDWAAEQVVMTDPRGLSGGLVPLGTANDYKPGELPGGRAFQGSRGTPESFSNDPLATTWKRPAMMPLTEAGKNAVKNFDGGSHDNPRLNCQSTNILFDWSFDNPINHIFQNDKEIRLTYGTMNMVRTIHLDQREFPAKLTPSRTGYSLGHWEKDVLVVETRGFLAGILSADTSTPHSDKLRVIERFSLDTTNGALVRDFEAEDGVYWSGIYKGRDSMFVSSHPYEQYNCDDRSFHTDQLKKK